MCIVSSNFGKSRSKEEEAGFLQELKIIFKRKIKQFIILEKT